MHLTLFADDCNALITGDNLSKVFQESNIICSKLSKWFNNNLLTLNDKKLYTCYFVPHKWTYKIFQIII